MPYIKQTQRKRLNSFTAAIGKLAIADAGELNYLITVGLKNYFESHGGNYQAANDIMGALEGAKLEFYRRTIAPYEDVKIKENGDV